MIVRTFFLAFLFITLDIKAQDVTEIIADLAAEELQNLDISQNQNLLENESGEPSLEELNDFDRLDTFNRAYQIFGFSYVNTTPTSISATADLPVPNNYRISLGDTLTVILSGTKQKIITLKVELNGSILFPEIGSIQVVGDTYSELKTKLRNLVETVFVGVNIDISVSSLSAKKISIIGAVEKPGTYLVNPFTTISNVLAYSGGLRSYSSLRNIELIRASGESLSFDLYDLLINGDRSSDINIEAGDTVVINSTKNLVSVDGRINRPAIYEYKDGETVQDIIEYAMGTMEDSNLDKIALKVFDEKLDLVVTNEISIDKVTSMQKIRAINVFRKDNFTKFDIEVVGPLVNSGYFSHEKYQNLVELLPDLVLTDNVYKFVGIVETGSVSKLFSLFDSETQNIPLTTNSKVFFFNLNNYADFDDQPISFNSRKLLSEYALRLNLDDRNIDFPIFGKFSPVNITNFLGLDLSSIEKTKTTYISPLEDLTVVGEILENVFEAQKFNSLSFRYLKSDLINVSINGEVNLPGDYSLPPNSTLEDLYKLAGGVKETADNNAALFFRESVRELQLNAFERSKEQLREYLLLNAQEGNSVLSPGIASVLQINIDAKSLGRIAGDFTEKSNINDSFLLQGGDSLFIPKKQLTVTIIGEVLNPTTVLFNEKLKLKDYITNSGGYKQYALKREIYVISSDGRIRKVPRNIFIRNVNILPGDTIVVPRDLVVSDNLSRLLLPMTSIISNMAFAAASLQALRNN
mgnify:CR=1 FL=1|tara:strand:+ start:13710 stop:15959 length:2250 start_codon:yes stop_codon:yes gene_type:complete